MAGYEGYASYGTPADNAQRLAAAQLQEGSSSAPIASKWQGVARLANALMGGIGERQAMQSWQQSMARTTDPATWRYTSDGGAASPGAAALGGAMAPPPQAGAAPAAPPSPMGPPQQSMIPNNAAGGQAPGVVGTGVPGGMDPNLLAAMQGQKGVQVASNDPNFMPSFPQPSPDKGQTGDVAGYIAQRAQQMGIDPNVALRVAGHEGLKAFSPNAPDRGGDGGSSFGPFQLHYGGVNPSMPHGGMGDDFTAATGLDARDPATWKQQIDFSLQHAKQNGWGAWMGAKAEGITGFDGIGAPGRGGDNGGSSFLHSSVAGPGAPSNLGGGASGPGQAQMHPNFEALKSIIMNPYSDPQVRQAAIGMIQQSQMPQVQWIDIPNSNTKIGVDRYGRPIPGMQIQGPHKQSVVDAGTDLLGVKHQGIFDEQTGAVKPIEMNGGQTGSQGGALPPPGGGGAPPSIAPGNIPPPNPAWTPQGGQQGPAGASQAPAGAQVGQGQPGAAPGAPGAYPSQASFDQRLAAQQQNWMATLTPKYGPEAAGQVAQLAKNYLSGSQALPNGTAQAKPLEQLAWNLATQADPTLRQQRYATMQSFSPGTGGNDDKTVLYGRAAIAHSSNARSISDQLAEGQSNTPIIGPIINWAKNEFKNQGDAADYEAKARTAFNEVNKAYVGGPGTAEERELPAELKANANPEVRTRYWAALGQQLQDKITKMQEGYHNGAGNVPDFPLLNADDQGNLQRMEDLGKWAKGGKPQDTRAQEPGNGRGIPEVSEQEYNQLPSGAHYRVPGQSKVMVKP